MELPEIDGAFLRGCTVPPERMREWYLKQVVEPGQKTFENICERSALLLRQVGQVQDVAPGKEKHFKGPDRPEWHEENPVRILHHDPLGAVTFIPQVVQQENRPGLRDILSLVAVFLRRFGG
jgi:hypothetical protein